jgi:ABC-2 type transport system permease protein
LRRCENADLDNQEGTMMKIIAITFKDMTQSFRSLFAVVFMFVVPVLMTGMFYVMFGGSQEEDEVFTLPVTRVILVNQDAGGFASPLASEGLTVPVSPDPANVGDLLLLALQSEALADVLEITVIDRADLARQAVDNQEADLALIIPERTTQIFMASQSQVAIEAYQDAVISVGPEIVKGIVSQIMDSFSAHKIVLGSAVQGLYESGIQVSEAQIEDLVAKYLEANLSPASDHQSGTAAVSLEIHALVNEAESSGSVLGIISLMMTGMSIFFIFFTGANTAQSILREEIRGTMPRLFTTPNRVATILGGKFLAVVLTIFVQLSILLFFGYVLFGINWGDWLSVTLLGMATTLTAAAFGIFVMSWVHSERQAGFAIGALVTITGMVGMMPVFIAGMPDPPNFFKTVSLLVPQGWAGEGFRSAMLGDGIASILPHVTALLIWSAVFSIVGLLRFRRRYV